MQSIESLSGDVAEQLTNLPSDFASQILKDVRTMHWFPCSTDLSLDSAYEQAITRLPEPRPGTIGVGLIVGNGSFETATQLFPDELPIIFCDQSARTLHHQRVLIELMRQSSDCESFCTLLDDYGENFWDYCRAAQIGGERGGAFYVSRPSAVDYISQRQGWRNSEVPHYLDSQSAYTQARDAVLARSYGFRLLNLGVQFDIEQFSSDLQAAECSIVCANFTNVFEDQWASREAGRFAKTHLPFAPDAQVISSRLDRDDYLRSRATNIAGWLPEVSRVPVSEKADEIATA